LPLLYNLFIRLYALGISVVALRNKKAARWRAGRNTLWTDVNETLRQAQDKPFSKRHAVIWIHSASAGEFEQAKPLIEALKKYYPAYKILVTFFSPSGYPTGKKFALADYVFYLPLDTAENAARFVRTVQPKLVVFIKYDFWYHHLKAVHDQKIPLLLASALFRENQLFFKPYGGFYRRMLHFFTHLFVQDKASYDLLKKFGITHSTVAGDTRFDRVQAIGGRFEPVPFLEEFTTGKMVVVAGSTWPDDEKMLHGVLKKFDSIKLIIAPHEIDAAHVNSIAQLFQKSIRYSTLKEMEKGDASTRLNESDVLIIDNVGMLSRLYKYAIVTYVGGGFNKSGIHNTLEAAVFGKPVVFGPNYQKFREARALIECGGAFNYSTEQELESILHRLLADEPVLKQSSEAAAAYVHRNGGATENIIRFIQENRLLTSL
jgi:3-deoxy-D-manno-octulosonic-acid transferase